MRRLVIRMEALGDFVMTLPALECLRRGCEHFEVWARAPLAPLVQFADRVRPLLPQEFTTLHDAMHRPFDLERLRHGASPKPATSLVEEIYGFDSIVFYCLQHGESPRFVPGISCTELAILPALNAIEHATDFYLRQVRGLTLSPGVASSDGIPRISCGSAARERLVILHPFSSTSRYVASHTWTLALKDWPLDSYRRLARMLEDQGIKTAFVRGPNDPPFDGAVCFENLWDLARWISGAALYIGNDTGSTHVAAATGTPTIALFGPSNPAIFGPRGPHVRIERFMPFAEPERLKREEESVFRAAMEMLEQERMKAAA